MEDMRRYADVVSDLSKIQYEYSKLAKEALLFRRALTAIAVGNFVDAKARAQLALDRAAALAQGEEEGEEDAS